MQEPVQHEAMGEPSSSKQGQLPKSEPMIVRVYSHVYGFLPRWLWISLYKIQLAQEDIFISLCRIAHVCLIHAF